MAATKGVQFYVKDKAKITGKEWFQEQESYIDNLKIYAKNLDDIYSLYISGSIDESDFLEHMEVFQKQLSLLELEYQQKQKQHPVRIGSHTYYTKIGCESVEECFDVFDRIIKMSTSKTYYSDKEKMAYAYIAFSDQLTEQVAGYEAAELFVKKEAVTQHKK